MLRLVVVILPAQRVMINFQSLQLITVTVRNGAAFGNTLRNSLTRDICLNALLIIPATF